MRLANHRMSNFSFFLSLSLFFFLTWAVERKTQTNISFFFFFPLAPPSPGVGRGYPHRTEGGKGGKARPRNVFLFPPPRFHESQKAAKDQIIFLNKKIGFGFSSFS